MTDEPYPPPPPPAPPAQATTPTGPSRRAPLAMIIGVVVLAVLTVILLAMVLTRDDGTATASESPTPSTSASASASGSASLGPSSSASAAATGSADAPAQPELAADSVVATTVENLTVRGAPGLDSQRLGSLDSGSLSFVAGGPTDADGFRWYLVSGLGLPPNTGCAGDPETDPYNCPIWFGWAAAASESGEPWLVQQDIACPTDPLTAENLALGRTALERLSCFGSEPITFRGWWPEIPDDAGLGGACAFQEEPSGFLLCQNINYNLILADDTEDFFGIGVKVSIDPSTDAAMPERGTWVEVRVHLDDPAAQSCGEDGNAESELETQQLVLACRAEMVLEAAQAIDGP
jgi:hypothetical protein